jgi:hypothetical protein
MKTESFPSPLLIHKASLLHQPVIDSPGFFPGVVCIFMGIGQVLLRQSGDMNLLLFKAALQLGHFFPEQPEQCNKDPQIIRVIPGTVILEDRIVSIHEIVTLPVEHVCRILVHNLLELLLIMREIPLERIVLGVLAHFLQQIKPVDILQLLIQSFRIHDSFYVPTLRIIDVGQTNCPVHNLLVLI